MQGKWLIPNWLFEVWPFLLPSSHRHTNGDAANYQTSHMQNNHFSKLVRTLGHDFVSKSRGTDLGGAWKAALQAAIGIWSWQDIRESRGRQRTFGDSHQSRSCLYLHVSASGSLDVLLSLAYTHSLSLLLGHFFTEANSLCFPGVLALCGTIMTPLENLPSKLLPSQIHKAEDDTSENSDYVGHEAGLCVMDKHTFYAKVQDNVDKVVVEPETGFEFPVMLCPNEHQRQTPNSSIQILAGVGLRSLTIVKLKSIKIYAFGFYIKPDIFKVHFNENYGDVPVKQLKHDPSFYEDLLRHELGMTVRLMVHYKALKMGMVRSAFDGSLRNRLKKIKGVEDDEGLESFNAYFSQNLLLPRGTIIDFQWLPGGELRTEIDGKLLGTIHSRDFCRAFFDLYIGDPPVSLKAKEKIGEKLGHILRVS